MHFLFNKKTLFGISFLSFCLIVIGYLLQTILIPLQNFDSINRQELLELQKEYALNYSFGTGILYLGIFFMILVLILFIIKFKKNNKQKSDA